MANLKKLRQEHDDDRLKALNAPPSDGANGHDSDIASATSEAFNDTTFTNALIEEDKQNRLAPLQEEHGELSNAIAEHNGTDRSVESNHIKSTVDAAASQMDMIADRCKHTIKDMACKARTAEGLKRQFQANNRVFRDVKETDLLQTFLIICLCFTVETGITALSLYADGHMDLAPALGFAAMFSLINITLGLGGGFTARFISYRANHARQLKEYKLVQNLAKSGVAAMVFLHVLIVFVAGRVRVTGSHGAVFDFHGAGFFTTFGDGMGLLIMIAAVLSFSVSMYKGFNALLDRVPEYNEYAPKLDFDAQVASQADQAFDCIDDIFEDTKEEVDGLHDEQEESFGLPNDISSFNADIKRERGEHKVFALSVYEREKFVLTDGQTKPPVFDLSEFDALHLKSPVTTHASVDKPHIGDLKAAHSKAASRITDALSQYHADVEAFRTPPTSLR